MLFYELIPSIVACRGCEYIRTRSRVAELYGRSQSISLLVDFYILMTSIS